MSRTPEVGGPRLYLSDDAGRSAQIIQPGQLGKIVAKHLLGQTRQPWRKSASFMSGRVERGYFESSVALR
jgi:hypothetical protein